MKSIVGKILRGRYSIVRELSKNNFYTKYLAEDREDRQHYRYEIERFQPEYDRRILSLKSWQYLQKRFITESAVLEKLGKHPQIPEIIAYFIDNREFYLVREYIQGETLAAKIARQPFDETEANIWLQDILNILHFVHQINIAHSNLNPDSLIQRQQDNRIFLTNFAAISRLISTFVDRLKSQKQTSEESSLFLLNINTETPDFREDIYDLGQTIIYGLTGGQFRSISAANLHESEKISPKLIKILKKMTAEHPRERYHSVIEVLKDLEREEKVIVFPSPLSLEIPYTRSKTKTQSTKIRLKTERQSIDKRILWFFLLLPFIASLITLFIGFKKNSYRNFLLYTNNNYRVEMQYPENWSVRNVEDPITGEIVVFNSPRENELDLFQEKVYLTVEPLSSEINSLEKYTKDVVDKIGGENNQTVQIEQQKQIKINERDANLLVYSRQENGLIIRQLEAFIIKNNRIYIFIFMGEKAKYSEFYGTVKKMLDSLELQ
jgi:serine/threonine-protein kinase